MNPRMLTIRFPSHYGGPEPGDAMLSNGGSCYLVLASRRVQHREPSSEQAWRLTCERLDDLPLDTIIHPFEWDRRGRHSPPKRRIGES